MLTLARLCCHDPSSSAPRPGFPYYRFPEFIETFQCRHGPRPVDRRQSKHHRLQYDERCAMQCHAVRPPRGAGTTMSAIRASSGARVVRHEHDRQPFAPCLGDRCRHFPAEDVRAPAAAMRPPRGDPATDPPTMLPRASSDRARRPERSSNIAAYRASSPVGPIPNITIRPASPNTPSAARKASRADGCRNAASASWLAPSCPGRWRAHASSRCRTRSAACAWKAMPPRSRVGQTAPQVAHAAESKGLDSPDHASRRKGRPAAPDRRPNP